MNHHVVAERDGILQERRCKSVVDDGDEFVFFGERHGFVNIDEAEGGVSGRFDVKNFRTRRDKILNTREIGANLPDGDPHVGKDVAHQAIRAAVGLRGGDDFVAGLERGEQSGRDRGHAGRRDYSGLRTFQGSNFLLGDRERGIAVTGVNVSFVFALGPQLHFFGGRKGKSGRADNLGHNGTVDAPAVGFTAVNGLGLRSEFCGLAGFHVEECAPWGQTKTASKLAGA